MLYETTRNPPGWGEFRFLVFTLVFIMRSDKAFQSTMIQASATVAAGSDGENVGKNLQKQIDDFVESWYPFMEGQRESKDKQAKEILDGMAGTAFHITRSQSFHKRK